MTTTHLQKRHKRSDNDPIPVDLVINILSRLPVKFIAKFRCVSKLWSSIIRRPNYNQLFPIKSPPSPATPRFLFIVETNEELVFSSSPQRCLDYNTSLVATFHSKKSARESCKICPPVKGLVCLQYTGEKYTYAVISNPITGEYVTTPKLKKGFSHHQFVIKLRVILLMDKMYFGYDPIEKQFKVICMTWLTCDSKEYQVLTLGNGNLSWRKIGCDKLHYPIHYPQEDVGICINGFLYYQAMSDYKRLIVCFDIKSEKFSFVNIDQNFATKMILEPLILINYKNKLGVIHCPLRSSSFELRVLENAEEHKWSDHFYNMHEVLRPCHKESSSFSARMFQSGEIVLCRYYARNLFYIFFYNLEINIIRSVRLQVPGLDYVEYRKVHTFPNFLEDATLV